MLPYISMFGHHIQSYYLCAVLAGTAGVGLSIVTLKGERLGVWRFLLPVLVAVLALVGARLLNYCLNPSAYGAAFPIWTISYRRLSLMGGLIAGIAVLLVFVLLAKRSPWSLLDNMVLPGGASIVFLKAGCFLNGCCFGKPADNVWGMVFPANKTIYDYLDTLSLVAPQTRSVYPTQLYELLGAALGLGIIIPLGNRLRLPSGMSALLYAIWFTLVRLVVHPFRSFPYEQHITQIAYPVFYCSLLLVLAVALVVLGKWRAKRRRPLAVARRENRCFVSNVGRS